MQAWILRVAHSLPALIDIVGDGAAKRGDGGTAYLTRDSGNSVEVGRRSGGKPRLDAIHLHMLQHFSDAQLLLRSEGDTGCLLTVAQGRVEDLNSVRHSSRSLKDRGGTACRRPATWA